MSVASVLLRVVLMISLLSNGLNAAMAGEHRRAPPDVATAASGPPCHAHADVAPKATGTQAQAPADEGHCKLKECVRACAQQPALAADGLPFLPAAYAGAEPAHRLAPGHPTPALPRIQRPPIG